MENKRFNLAFWLVVVFFLAAGFILCKYFKTLRAIDLRQYKVVVSELRMQNDRIKILVKENADLKNTLADTRNSLDALSRKLAQPAPVAAPASLPAPASVTK